jgi:5-carboxymethyl-2-hydroxymuconate isomerase
MAHLTLLYSANLEAATDVGTLCRSLADALLAVRDEQGQIVFPPGGVRVFAYPAAHYAIADGRHDYAFMYLNVRMGRGRSERAKQSVGEAVMAVAKRHLEPVIARGYLGLTLQIDEGQQVFDARHGNIHSLFKQD